jgi:hypothetical protein
VSRRKIYLLQDPVTLEPKYIGRTERNLKERLSGHLSQKGDCPKTQWISELKTQGLRPIIHEIEADGGHDAESFWVAYFRSLGAELTNQHLNGYRPSAEVRAKIVKGQRAALERRRAARSLYDYRQMQEAARKVVQLEKELVWARERLYDLQVINGVEPEELVIKGVKA